MDHLRQIYIPPEGPPQGNNLSPQIYEAMREENIFRMIEDFYGELKTSPIGGMFPSEMKEASRKTAKFFVFLLGGPPLYQEEYGSPMMRRRHLPFAIDEQARMVWLDCFKKILVDSDRKYNFPQEHLDSFICFLERFSAWMVNCRTPAA